MSRRRQNAKRAHPTWHGDCTVCRLGAVLLNKVPMRFPLVHNAVSDVVRRLASGPETLALLLPLDALLELLPVSNHRPK